MPYKMQLAAIRRILRLANTELEDPDVLPNVSVNGRYEKEYEWADDVDPNLSLPENLDCLKQLISGVNWQVPKIAENKPLRDKQIIRDEKGVLIREEVIIKRHPITAKGKHYEHGRIQIILDKSLIGSYALVQVYIPEKHADTEGMPYARTSNYLYQHERKMAELFENRNRNPRIEKEIAEKMRQAKK